MHEEQCKQECGDNEDHTLMWPEESEAYMRVKSGQGESSQGDLANCYLIISIMLSVCMM